MEVQLPDLVVEESIKASPLQKSVNPKAHKRSGKSGQFNYELDPGTIDRLNSYFKESLEFWEIWLVYRFKLKRNKTP